MNKKLRVLLPTILSLSVISTAVHAAQSANEEFIKKKIEEGPHWFSEQTDVKVKKIAPIRVIDGRKNPELIAEHKGWKAFYSRYVSLTDERSIESSWYTFRQDMPGLSRNDMETLIAFGRKALYGEEQVHINMKQEYVDFCEDLMSRIDTGNKLSNARIKQWRKQRRQKIPDYYEQVKRDLTEQFSAQTIETYKNFILNHVLTGMTESYFPTRKLSEYDPHAYSDWYESNHCKKRTR